MNGIGVQLSDNTIINNFITGSGFDGVLVFESVRNIIKGNTIVNSRNFGISLDVNDDDGTTNDDNQILDNTIISSENSGITVIGKRVVIQGNTINQSGKNGIDVDSSDLISEGVIIKDNSITNSDEFGIEIYGESLNTVVIDNTFAGNTDGPIGDDGDGTTQAGNISDN